MLTEVEELDAGEGSSPTSPAVAPEHEDLTTVRDGHDARRPVHRRAEVVAVAPLGLTGVQAHPDAQRAGDFTPPVREQGALRVDGSGHRVVRRAKRGVRAVTGGLDEQSGLSLDRRAQDRVVLGQRGAHRLGMVLPKGVESRDR